MKEDKNKPNPNYVKCKFQISMFGSLDFAVKTYYGYLEEFNRCKLTLIGDVNSGYVKFIIEEL